jgi:ribosomal protein S18 acetylase RimI-like enzyme
MTHEASDAAVVVRAARLEDLPAAAKLAAELVRQHNRYDPLRFMRIEPLEEGYRHYMRSQVDREGVVFLVAVAAAPPGDLVVGYVLGGLEDRDWMDLRDACGKIYDIIVDDAFRGRGIAGRLLDEAVSRLTALGAPRVVLMAAWRNENARQFFERRGFRPTMLEMTREARQPTGGGARRDE